MEHYGVVVSTPERLENLQAEDRNVPGTYDVFIEPRYPEDVAASIALDVFHVSVPITCLEDFCLQVQDEAGHRIEESADHISYSGSELGYLAVAFDRDGGIS